MPVRPTASRWRYGQSVRSSSSSVAGVEDDGRPAQSKEESSGMGTSLLSELRRELDAAVQDEDYEQAAKLRDRINELEKD